jgi:hypothetical protein
MSTPSHTPPSIVTEVATFIGIDYHKKYSVYHAVDSADRDLGKGRIEHHSPHDLASPLVFMGGPNYSPHTTKDGEKPPSIFKSKLFHQITP